MIGGLALLLFTCGATSDQAFARVSAITSRVGEALAQAGPPPLDAQIERMLRSPCAAATAELGSEGTHGAELGSGAPSYETVLAALEDGSHPMLQHSLALPAQSSPGALRRPSVPLVEQRATDDTERQWDELRTALRRERRRRRAAERACAAATARALRLERQLTRLRQSRVS